MSETLNFKKKRSKLIFEARYDSSTWFFDNRGTVLETLKARFKGKLEDWRLNDTGISFVDRNENPQLVATIGHMNSSFVVEGVESVKDFEGYIQTFTEAIVNTVGRSFSNYKRIGVRSVAVHEHPALLNFDTVCAKIQKCFLAPNLPLTVKTKDLQIILDHDQGRILVGPIKRGEPWAKVEFSGVDKDDYVGVGTDIDSYATEIECDRSRRRDLMFAFSPIFGLTIAKENEILKGIIGGEGLPRGE